MKPILFLIDELEVGGSQRQILLLARALVQAGHSVTVGYFRAGNDVLRPDFEAAGVVVQLIAKRSGFDPLFLMRLARLLFADRDRLVLSFGYTANLWSRLAALPGRAPAQIACIRNLGYLPRREGAVAKVMGRLERTLARRSSWVVANSQVTAESMVARGLIPPDKILVIPNAVETAAPAPRKDARPKLRQLAGGAEPAPIVGTLARLVPEKDLPTLVRAARRVVDRFPQARFVVGGEGPGRAALESLRRELGLERHLLLPGTLSGRELISGFDVAVLSSSSEGMPNFVLEAMAAGVPVASTRAGAAPELLEEGRLGRLAAIGDADALGDAICDALDHPEDAAARATQAAVKARTMSPAQIAGRYLALFADSSR